MNTLKRKFRKLKNNPKLFFKDWLIKNKQIANKYLPTVKSAQCNNSYTIVSAVYNVEKYLDDYFQSIVNQSVGFKKHIKIICVDDGSTDNSAAIIKKWQSKYPNNITYIYKENGGQSSARNLGLQHVDTDWVTFIDPDDFISKNYFEEIDKQIEKDKDVVLVAANLLFYYEKNKHIKDTHPLKFKFNKTHTIKLADNVKEIQLSAATSVLNKNLLIDFFDERVKPNFEDAKFINTYLLSQPQNKKISFIKEIAYFYRKREDGSSTLDGVFHKKEKFDDVLQYGKLDLLKKGKTLFEKTPNYIQNLALYDLFWYISFLLNNTKKMAWLSQDEQNKFLELFTECFQYIDEKRILEFNLAGCWLKHKVGMLGQFKQSEVPFQIVYVEKIDREKKQILLSYYYYFEHQDCVALNGQDVVPMYQKTIYNEFAGQPFCYERRYWIPFIDEKQMLKIYIDGKTARVSVKGNQYKDGVKISEILKAFQSNKYANQDGSWLFIDRDTQADDNAEHLYRWVSVNHPEQKIYFALNKDSQDWNRLEQEGFNLVAFGSNDYEQKLRKCSKLISSEASGFICNYFQDNYDFMKHFVWLQHGVIKDDLSNWVNTKPNMNLFVTSTKDEYHSIVYGDSYKFSEKEVVLTGLPRHDTLLRNNNKHSKTVLVMPSWRAYLFAENISFQSSEKSLKTDFVQSEYYKCWGGFLKSERLHDILTKYGFELVFAPHYLMQPYLKEFGLPEFIQIWSKSSSKQSIQELFRNSCLMITDYSSTAFDAAYLGKGSLYYQFDKDEFFANHTYKQGYFDYERDGFGAVAYTEEELLNNLEQVLKNDCNFAEKYRKNLDIFPARDGKNCERVYQAILDLDKPEKKEYPDLNILRERLNQALQFKAWKLAFKRANELKKYVNQDEKVYLEDLQLQAVIWGKIENEYAQFLPLAYERNPQNEHIVKLYVNVLLKNKNWAEIVRVIESLAVESELKYALNNQYVLSLWEQGEIQKAYRHLSLPKAEDSYEYLDLMVKIALSVGDNKMARQALILMIQHYPNQNKTENLILLSNINNVGKH